MICVCVCFLCEFQFGRGIFENETKPQFEKTDKARFEIGVIKLGRVYGWNDAKKNEIKKV